MKNINYLLYGGLKSFKQSMKFCRKKSNLLINNLFKLSLKEKL